MGINTQINKFKFAEISSDIMSFMGFKFSEQSKRMQQWFLVLFVVSD